MAEPESQTAVVRSLTAILSPPAEQDLSHADIRAAIESHFHMEIMAAGIVGGAWSTATAAQRARLCAALLGPVTRALEVSFVGRPKLILLPQRPAKNSDRWEVSTVLSWPTGQSVNATWRVMRIHGDPGIYDASIDRVSIMESMRSQFFDILAKQGIDGLSARLEAVAD